MERKRTIKNGHITVKNPLAYELPVREVIIKSGRTTYRFTGSYDGKKSLPNKVLRLITEKRHSLSYAVSRKQSYAVLLGLPERAGFFHPSMNHGSYPCCSKKSGDFHYGLLQSEQKSTMHWRISATLSSTD